MHNCDQAYYKSLLMKGMLSHLATSKESNATEWVLHRLEMFNIQSVTPCMECAPCYDFIFYAETLASYLRSELSQDLLANRLHEWKKIQLIDEVLTNTQSPIVSNINFNKKSFEATGLMVYVDQNILSLYAKDGGIKAKINSLKENVELTFFYSPSNLEEIYKIPKQHSKQLIINALTELTNNVVILPSNNANEFFIEPPSYGLKRIESYKGSTEALEELKLVSAQDRRHYLKKYDTQEHKKHTANNKNIFGSLSNEEFKELAFLSHSSFCNKSDFKDIKSRIDMLHAMYTLSKMLDLIGYKVDSVEKTQKSSLHDIEHLNYGLHADYFITHDDKFRCRAIQIYKFLNADVKVMTLNDFLAEFSK